MTESTGTGRTLHEMSAYTNLENEYDADVANTVTAKAINRAHKDAHVTPTDVGSWAKVNRIMARGEVDIEKKHRFSTKKQKNLQTKCLAASCQQAKKKKLKSNRILELKRESIDKFSLFICCI